MFSVGGSKPLDKRIHEGGQAMGTKILSNRICDRDLGATSERGCWGESSGAFGRGASKNRRAGLRTLGAVVVLALLTVSQSSSARDWWPGLTEAIKAQHSPGCKGLCQAGEGHCNSDFDCEAGLVCETGGGDGLNQRINTCEHPPGHLSRCTPETPCDVGEGDCDVDADCMEGTVCRRDKGEIYGFASIIDVCAPEKLQCPEDYFSPAERAAAPDTRFRFPVDNTPIVVPTIWPFPPIPPIPPILGEPFVVHVDHGDHIPYVGTSFDGTFTSYDGHRGTDFGLNGGFLLMDRRDTWVVAAADGVVESVVDTNFDRCRFSLLRRGVVCNELFEDERRVENNSVTVCHASGRRTEYHHIMQDSALVSPGDEVHCGEDLAVVASAGKSAGPHLHFVTRLCTESDEWLDSDMDGIGDHCLDTKDPYSIAPALGLWVMQEDPDNFGLPGEICQ